MRVQQKGFLDFLTHQNPHMGVSGESYHVVGGSDQSLADSAIFAERAKVSRRGQPGIPSREVLPGFENSDRLNQAT